jgi:hypothetical protein
MTCYVKVNTFFSHGSTAPSGPGPPHCRGFMIILRYNSLGRAPLDELSARRRDLYLTTHITHNRQTSMPPAGSKPAIQASERSLTHASHRAATRIGYVLFFPMARQPYMGLGLLVSSRFHDHTHQSVKLLWTRDQLVAETST